MSLIYCRYVGEVASEVRVQNGKNRALGGEKRKIQFGSWKVSRSQLSLLESFQESSAYCSWKVSRSTGGSWKVSRSHPENQKIGELSKNPRPFDRQVDRVDGSDQGRSHMGVMANTWLPFPM